jgi:glycosyltransferase involved in cell wall biosynthesis
MAKPTLFVIAPFHETLEAKNSCCAFSQKALKFSKMMQAQGYEVVEYANSPSESECAIKIPMLTREELDQLAGKRESTQFHGAKAIVGSPHWTEFDKRLKVALSERVKDGDIICHPFGRSHIDLPKLFPKQFHVETGIGYPDAPFGCYRIFESYCWMAYHQGKHLYFDANGRVLMKDSLPVIGRSGSDYEWVVPNYFDLDEWKPSYAPGKYVLFFGRICSDKGMDIVKAIAEAGVKVKVAGQGDMTPWKHPNLEYLGPILGKDRNELLANATCMLMPTRFVEPFGGSGVEAALCGSPLLSSDFGAFAETVDHGLTGYRCHTLADWLEGIKRAPELSRRLVAHRARQLYSLETCGKQYDRIFTQISDLKGDGWYTKRPLFV